MNPLSVLRHPRLTPAAKCVWFYLRERQDDAHPTYTGSVQQIARGIGVHERTIFELLRQLEAAGLIHRERRGIYTNAIHLRALPGHTITRGAPSST